MYDQGMVLYETSVEKLNYECQVIVHDFALVYLGKKLIEVFDRTKKT